MRRSVGVSDRKERTGDGPCILQRLFLPEPCAGYMRAADRVLCVPPCGCDHTQGYAAVK